MTTSKAVLIGDESGQHVLIETRARKHPDLFDSWDDGNWVSCDVRIVVSGFRAAFQADLRSEEFETFLEELTTLRESTQGSARFATLEQQLDLTLAAESRGAIAVRGEARDLPGSGNRLQFDFQIDQTYLPAIISAIESVLAALPVVGAPEPSDA